MLYFLLGSLVLTLFLVVCFLAVSLNTAMRILSKTTSVEVLLKTVQDSTVEGKMELINNTIFIIVIFLLNKVGVIK